MIVIGIDLSGPAEGDDLALAVFASASGGLRLLADGRLKRNPVHGIAEGDLAAWCDDWLGRAPLIAGIDAPLSRQDDGGDRPGDVALHATVVQAGHNPESLTPGGGLRRALLGPRGTALAQRLEAVAGGRRLRLCEVHPGAAMALRGAPKAIVRSFRRLQKHRERLMLWLADQGLTGMPAWIADQHRLVAACACAFAAWHWAEGRAAWREAAQAPEHPYDSCA